MNIDKKVGENIRKYRTAYNMTLKDLAEKLHKSVSTISKYEKGDISLDISTFLEMTNIFHVSPMAILGTTDAVIDEPHYSSHIEKKYMYSYDGVKKTFVQSIIELQKIDGTDNRYQVQLFNAVDDPNKQGECEGLYTGEYEREGFIGTYMLHNQLSKSEHIMISCVNNLVNPSQQVALVSGLSNYTMLPITFKAVISSTPINSVDKLQSLITFSKEELKFIKQMNYVSIQNLK